MSFSSEHSVPLCVLDLVCPPTLGELQNGEEPMKIAQIAPVSQSCPPHLYGGTERIVSYLTEELVRQGTRSLYLQVATLARPRGLSLAPRLPSGSTRASGIRSRLTS